LPEAVVDGETGLLVPTHDEPALAAAIVELLQNPERRVAMGVAGRRRVIDQFSVEHMVEATLGVYSSRTTYRSEVTGQR
jgi:glycosyltransferase involved in cell wall biosynthesis